jgi:hypothetical protein
MYTKDLVDKLVAKFGDIERISIDVVEKHEDEDETIIITGVMVAVTKDGKALCGMEVISMRCSFKNGIYSNVPVGLIVHEAMTNKPDIFVFFSTEVGISYLSVPCEFGDVDIDKFTVVGKVGEPCPYRGTEKCPLYRYNASNQQKDEKPRVPIII